MVEVITKEGKLKTYIIVHAEFKIIRRREGDLNKEKGMYSNY
ncbi:hypothetical protein DSOL_5193 [Desulfosporosinus metallidurans]|uniref:Uncharacterized protein n=1 Tax=Desulfosporosinus metallidurans TaxID=1888891 RepID=A0A1Q8QEX9_9FIRM|nr:hypothetical protein DSOL_5193 [Desulfosporosinus metallidurans]